MPLLPLILTAAFGATAAPAGPPPEAYAGPDGRSALASWTFDGHDVTVPHSANPATPGTAAAARAFKGGVGTYRTTLQLPSGRYAVRFESVASRAAVYLDGVRLATHARAYEPFEVVFRMDDAKHELAVRADWSNPFAQTREGLHRTWFNWGGMNREVTIRRLRDSAIAGVSVVTRLRGDGSARVTARARVTNLAGAARTVPAVLSLRGAGSRHVVSLGSARLAPGRSVTLAASFVVRRPDLWRPGHPKLYDLNVVVPFESGYRARVGLRQVSFAHGELRLNGKRLVLRGASLHEEAAGRGDALRPADMDALVRELRALHANATRAQHPLSAPLLERLDRAGIVVWQQIGPVDSPGRFRTSSGTLLAAAREDVRDDLRALRLHPSIVAWSLACEVAEGGAPGQAAFVDAAARELHAADPGRGVSVDIWGPHRPSSPSLLYRSLDAVGVTSYLGWYESPRAGPAAAARALAERVADLRATFPDKYVFVAELGAEGLAGVPSSRPGGRGYQAALLGAQLRAIPRDVGAYVWILRDFSVNPSFGGGTAAKVFPALRNLPGGSNQKGLFDAGGRAKPAAAAVRDAFRPARR